MEQGGLGGRDGLWKRLVGTSGGRKRIGKD